MKCINLRKRIAAILLTAVLLIAAVSPLSGILNLNNIQASDGKVEVDYTSLSNGAVTSISKDTYYAFDFSAVAVEKNGRYPGGAKSLLAPGWAYIYYKNEGTMSNPYITYAVKGGTEFKLECLANIAEISKKGTDWKLKVYTSANGTDWAEIIPTYTDSSGLQSTKLDRTYKFEKTLDSDTKYVMAVFPHTGNASGTAGGVAGNDFMGISKVEFTPADDPYKDAVYEKKLDFGALPTASNITKANKAQYYINDCKGIAVERHQRQIDDKANFLEANWNYLYFFDYGTLEQPYATFCVEGGTDFKLVSCSNIKLTNQVADRLGIDEWRLRVYTSVNGTDWVEVEPIIENINKLESNTFNQLQTFALKLPNDVKYVKAEFPHTGNASGTANTGLAGNDFIGIKSVYFTPDKDIEEEDYNYTYTTYYRYNKLSEQNTTDALFNDEYGLNRGNGVCVYKSEKDSKTYLGASQQYLANTENHEKANAVYHISGESDVKLAVSYDTALLANAANAQGKNVEDYTVKFYTSLDGLNWETFEIEPKSSGEGGLGRNDLYRFTFPGDAALLKIEFPQDIGYGSYASCVGIKEIALTKGVGKLGYYEKYYNFNSIENMDTISEGKAKDLYLYTQSNMACNKFGADGKIYLCANWWYLYNSINVSNPYVIYNVKPMTDFKAVVAHKTELCALVANRLGISPDEWTVKFYSSSDAKQWQPMNLQPTNKVSGTLGRDDIYEFTVEENVKYIKIVYPQTGNCDGTPGKGLAGNDFIGISQIGFTPGDDNFYNPYGNYKFSKVVDFSDMENTSLYSDVINSSEIYQCEAIRLVVANKSLQVNYEYLRLFESVDRPYVIYNVKPETAFQIATKYSAVRSAMTNSTGEDFSIRFYVSKDNRNWSKAEAVITQSSEFEIATIENVGSDVRFVKLEFPQTGDMSLITNGMTEYVGNDFVGISKISFTSGDSFRKVDDISDCKFTDKYDFSKDELDVSAFDSAGVVYDKGLKQVTSSWSYFYFSKSERNKPFIILPVKNGTAFYTSTSMRKMQKVDFTVDEFSFRIYSSSDEVNWTDITNQIKKSYYSEDDKKIIDEYLIEKIADGVRYIKIEFPQIRNYTDFITSKGRKQGYVGNDFCGIDMLCFSKSVNEPVYENILDYTELAESKTGLEGEVDSDRAGTLGLYDYDSSAIELVNVGNALEAKYIIRTQQSYIFNKTDVEKPYAVYNVKPGTAFEAAFYLPDDPAIQRIGLALGVGDTLNIKVYGSADSKNWKEISRETYNYVYSETDMVNTVIFKCADVGAKTNFIKIEFPITGDYRKITGNNDLATGETLYGISYVKCSLKEYNDTFEPVQYTFLDPNLFNIDLSKDPVRNYTPAKDGLAIWQIVLIVAASCVIVGAAITVVIVVLRKKTKKGMLNNK